MASLAATATGHTSGIPLLLLILVLVTVGYLASSWFWPFTNCRRCKGSGRRRSPFSGRSFGLCRHCDGTGRQLRIARHILNHLRRLHTRGTRSSNRARKDTR